MIDWQFFFLAWELKGKYPAILGQPAARELFDDANTLLDQIIADGQFRARGAYGFWPAHSEGDDILIDLGRRSLRVPMLRQQTAKPAGRRNRCLADYVAPAGDHLGGFAVAIHGAEELAATLPSRPRRLPVDHGQGTGRPARRSVRRAHPPAGPARLVRTGRRPGRSRTCTPSGSAASAPRSATPPARTTARNERCSTCSTPRSSA